LSEFHPLLHLELLLSLLHLSQGVLYLCEDIQHPLVLRRGGEGEGGGGEGEGGGGVAPHSPPHRDSVSGDREEDREAGWALHRERDGWALHTGTHREERGWTGHGGSVLSSCL